MFIEKYKTQLVSNSKITLSKYMMQFKNQDTIFLYEYATYLEYKDILDLDNFHFSQYIDIHEIESLINISDKQHILILVKDFYLYPKIFNFLYKNQLYKNDICSNLLLEMDILHDSYCKLLWGNIDKLTKKLTKEQLSKIETQNLQSYSDLFKALLKENNFILNNYMYALIYPKQYQDMFSTLDKTLQSIIIFFDGYSQKNNYFYGISYLKFFSFIDLFIGTSSNELPKNSKYINLKHGIMDQPSPITYTLELKEKNELTFYTNMKRKKADFNIIASKFLKSENTLLLGYPKLDTLINAFLKYQNKKSSTILITSSSILWQTTPYGFFSCNNNFIIKLLQKYNKYQIIFTPHPGEFNHQEILNYTRNLTKFNNFILDNTVSSIPNFRNTQLHISDGLSTSTYTYVFGTLKPIIFYIPNIEIYSTTFKTSIFSRYLHTIGDIVTNEDDLIKMSCKYLQNQNYIQHKSSNIKQFRDKTIVQIQTSQKHIEYFLTKYIHIESNNKIVNHYKNILIKNAKNKIQNYFNQFKNKKIAIYGSGNHFETILNNIYDFSTLNIVCFSDSNTNLIGTKKYNIPIISKDSLDNVDAIIISSKKYEKEIKKELDSFYVNVHTIYEHINEEIEICLNSKVWLNINILESQLLNEQINQTITLNFDNYTSLFQHLKDLYLHRTKTTIKFSNQNEDIYMNEKLFLYNTTQG